VIKIAAGSRALCMTLAILSHMGTNLEYQRNTILMGSAPSSKWVYDVVSPFLQWDGLHFLNIAARGYDSVLEHAFFPGLPLVMRVLSSIPNGLSIDPIFSLAISGIILAQLSAILGAVGLYKLSLHFCATQSVAFKATLFYIFCSCNVFMSAVYTESPFSMLTFWGLYWLYARSSFSIASMLFAIAGLFRSNGILAMIFVAHQALLSRQLYSGVMGCVLIYMPYFLYSTWSRNLYCQLIDPPHDWCESFGSIYGYIQKQFWGVSLFSYWRLGNVGYFILMLPALAVALHAPYYFARDHVKHIQTRNVYPILRDRMSPFLVQMGVLTAFTVLIANCQILTRILVSCPLFFWTIERITREASPGVRRMVVGAHLSYYIVGPLVFSNGLNWT